MPPLRSSVHGWLWVVPLLLLAGALAAPRLMTDALWYDEYWSLLNTGAPPYGPRSLVAIWNANLASNLWEPPGYYLLLGAWSAFAGWSHLASRFLSLLFGLLTIAMTYRLGHDLFSPAAGLGAAAAVGASAFFSDYLHEIRSYTLLTFLIVFVLWSYWRIINQRCTRNTEIGFVAAVASAMYVHYYAAVPLASLALYHVVFARQAGWRVFGLMTLSALFYLPWAGMALQGLFNAAGGDNYVIPSLNPETALRVLLHVFSNGSVALLALLVGLALYRRDRPAKLVWFCLLCSFALLLLVDSRLKILIHIRHLMPLLPLLALLVGLGVERLSKAGLHPALPLVVWVVGGIAAAADPSFVRNLPNTEPRLSWRALQTTLNVLREQAAAADALVLRVPADDRIMAYYFYHAQIDTPFKRADAFFDDASRSYSENLRQFVRGASQVWLLQAAEMPPFYQQDEFNAVVQENHVACGTTRSFDDMRLSRFVRLPAAQDGALFGTGITLNLLAPLPAQVDDTLTLVLGWSLADDVPRQQYSAALHIDNAAGELVRQHDYGLPDAPFSCQTDSIALDTLPPGEYTVYAVVYDWQTQARLPNADGDRLRLGAFRVVRPDK